MPNLRVRGEAVSGRTGVPTVERPPWMPAARFDDFQREALEQAEHEHMAEAHHSSRGLRMTGALAVIVGIATFITALWYKEGDVIITLTVLLVMAGILAMRTRRPASAEVRATADKLLAASLDRYHREQLAAADFFHAEGWLALKRSVLERIEARCAQCGRKASAMLVVEHITSRSEAPDRALDPDNVQIICHACRNEAALRIGTA